MTIAPQHEASAESENPEDGLFGPEFKPLTAEQARQWRSAHPAMSPWWVIVWQVAMAIGVALLAGLLAGWSAGWSAGYGALAVLLPAALMVRGLRRQRHVAQAGAAMLGFVIWESVKIALTVAMLLLAPVLIQPLNWLALVAGLIATMKVYWLAAWVHAKQTRRNSFI
jgi:ATP synthase protein I